MGHLKDALLLTVDDVAVRALEQVERLRLPLWALTEALAESGAGRAAAAALDELLSRLEDASAHYLPLPPTMRESRSNALHLLLRGQGV